MPYSSFQPIGSVQQIADQMRTGYFSSRGTQPRKWNLGSTGANAKNGVITYTFEPNWFSPTPDFGDYTVSSETREDLRKAFEAFKPLGIEFREVNDFNADIGIGKWGDFNDKYSGYDSYVEVDETGFIKRAGIDTGGLYESNEYLKSIMITLGIGSPGNYLLGWSNDYGNSDTVYANDTYQISQLSGHEPWDVWTSSDQYEHPNDYSEFEDPATLMPADWQALSDMYSEYGYAPLKGFTGNTIYGYGTNISTSESMVFANLLGNLSEEYAVTIIDGGGTDIINMYGIARDQKIDLRGSSAGSSNLNASTVGSNVDTYGNLLIAPGVIIENAKGGNGDDQLIGNAVNNVLDGSFGADNMAGLGGNDTYIVDNEKDLTSEEVNQGIDVERSSVTRVLSENIENLVLTGGSSINGTGNGLRNNITGNTGSNILNGAGGADTMAGLEGNDTYFVDNIQDSIAENANQGIDTVKSSISWILAPTFENLTLLGTSVIDATGNGINNILIGNSMANIIVGEGGDDTLDGAGGPDKLNGGDGNDVYIVDNAGDICTEMPNEGLDEVRATINWTLGANFENLILTGSQNIRAYGNQLNNTLIGNDGNNVIDGLAGSDNMEGRLGDDIYLVDQASDKTVEKANEGTDTVKSSLSWSLADNIENLELTGLDDLSATGNVLANSIVGNDGSNLIDGKQGADKMAGMDGNDVYLVDSEGDQVVEKKKQGIDKVVTGLSYKLPNNVEDLMLSGKGQVTVEGNKLNNNIIGNKKSNTINGGMGDDTIDGGKGIDLLLLSKKSNTLDLSIVESQKTGEGTMVISNIENVDAGKGNDVITGSKLKNTLIGGEGKDKLNGSLGNDYLDGGDGKDHLIGGSGKDSLLGGKDKDTFEVKSEKGHVIIIDFENGVDKILLADGTKDFSMKDKGDDAYLYQNKDLVGIVEDGAGLLTIKGSTLI